MTRYQDNQALCLNNSVALAHLCHSNTLKLIELVLSHNKHTMNASQQSASELLNSKDLPGVHKLIARDVANQIKAYTKFATSAYLLGCEAQSEMVEAWKGHASDHMDLASQALKAVAKSDYPLHPISASSMSIAQAALDASKSAISFARASSKA